MGQRPQVLPDDRLPGQRLRQGVVRRIVPSIALGDGPFHHRADPLAHAACGFGLVMPGRGGYCQHVGRGHLGHGERAKLWMRVLLQRGSPLRRVLGVAPAGAVQRLRTFAAASSEVGMRRAWRRSARGAPPARANLRLTKAMSRASANDTMAQPPSPSVREVPRITSRCTRRRYTAEVSSLGARTTFDG